MTFTKYMLVSMQKIISRNRDFSYRLTDQADRIIVWLVGFSIACIALTISNQHTLIEISKNLPLILVAFSSLTIILGILYRTFMYLAQTIENQMIINFEGYVEGYINPPDVSISRELKGSETIIDLINFLKEDFNVEVSEVNEENLNSNQISAMLSNLSSYYNSLADINNRHLESQITEIKNVLKSTMGYTEKKAERIFNPVKPKINWHRFYWFSMYLSVTLFLMTTLTFISGFTIFMLKFIKIICN